MNVNSTSSASSTDIWALLQAAQTSQSTSSSSTSSTSSTSSDSSSLSGPGQLFKELQSLSKSNPTEFKKITAQIASQLKSAASNSTDPNQANFLNQMAANFSNASQSGNFSDLFPSQSQGSSSSGQVGGTGFPPPPSAYGENSNSSSSSSSNSSSDPLASIFQQALSQIQTDLNATSTSAS